MILSSPGGTLSLFNYQAELVEALPSLIFFMMSFNKLRITFYPGYEIKFVMRSNKLLQPNHLVKLFIIRGVNWLAHRINHMQTFNRICLFLKR